MPFLHRCFQSQKTWGETPQLPLSYACISIPITPLADPAGRSTWECVLGIRPTRPRVQSRAGKGLKTKRLTTCTNTSGIQRCNGTGQVWWWGSRGMERKRRGDSWAHPAERPDTYPPEGESGGRGELSRALFQKGVSLLSDEEDKQVVRWESQAQPWPCRGCTNLRMPRNQRPSHGHCECIDGEVGRKRRQRSDPKT